MLGHPRRYASPFACWWPFYAPCLSWPGRSFFVMAFGIGAIPGFLALMLHTVGSLTKLFYEAVESAQDKPVRGLAACGASALQKVRFCPCGRR